MPASPSRSLQALGTYDATVRLHPEVVGSFKVVVQKDTKQ